MPSPKDIIMIDAVEARNLEKQYERHLHGFPLIFENVYLPRVHPKVKLDNLISVFAKFHDVSFIRNWFDMRRFLKKHYPNFRLDLYGNIYDFNYLENIDDTLEDVKRKTKLSLQTLKDRIS